MIKNAVIESTMLGREDHGIMTFIITINFDSCMSCGVGGYSLDQYDPDTKTRVFKAKSMDSYFEDPRRGRCGLLEKLPRKYIRFEDDGWGSRITKIGNIIEDKWLDFEKFFA